MTSLSVQWRRMGNEHFINIPMNMSPNLVKERLLKANNCYYKADTYADSPEEKASAKKNLAVTAGKIAEILRNLKERDSLIKFYYKECLSQFGEAMNIGGDNTEDWLIDIETKSLKTWLNLQDYITNENIEDRIRSYETFIPFIIGSEIKGSAYKDLAKCIFHLAISKLVDKDYKASLSLLKNAYSPLTEASTHILRSTVAEEELESLKEDIFVQTCIAESMQALNIADAMLESTIRNEEDVNFDMIWEILDLYRNVITLTRDRDIEMESIAHSRIGNIYCKILKLDSRARSYFGKCIELANTLIPRTMFDEEWYRLAMEKLRRYQQEEISKEEKKFQEERKVIMLKIQDQVKELEHKFKNSGKLEFLQFVYKKYPPKKENHKLGEIPYTPELKQLKKFYQKAVIHYHPDKVNIEKYGMEWKVLSEEIVKILTRQYENYKGF